MQFPQSCFHFSAFTQRSPPTSANAGLNDTTALRLMGRAELPFRQTPAANGFATDFASKFMLGGGG
jgi:hypothetical protein